MAHRLTRREATVAGIGAAAVALIGCGGDDEPVATTQAATASTPTGSTSTGSTQASCVLTPEQTEGPYYVADSLVRSNIREDREGAPLEMRLTVQDADACEPIEGATVEVWHCDAQGVYSGVQGDSEDFCRGAQTTGADGVATFQTVYPGWYQGRTTHIHVKVHVSGQEVHTGQIYFPDELNSRVGKDSAYKGDPDTTNATDSIYEQGSTLSVKRAGDGYTGTLAMGVRSA